MRYVFVLEDDLKFQREIVDALFRINPNLQIRLFDHLDQFADWVKDLMVNGKPTLNSAGKKPDYINLVQVSFDESDHLSLIVSRVEFLGIAQLGLLKKTKDLFAQKQINPEGGDTAIVITAFEGSNIKMKQLEESVITNVIYKPFDRLMLREHLAYALDGHIAPAEDHEIAQQKTSAKIEMLQDIVIEAISDVGFVAKVEKEIPVLTLSKFYGTSWTSETEGSVFAICTGITGHPIDPGYFNATYNFFDLSQKQISLIRKRVRNPKEAQLAWKWQHADSPKKAEYNFIVVDEDEHAPGGLVDYLKTSYIGGNVIHYNHYATFFLDFDPARAIQQRDETLRALPASVPDLVLHFDINTKIYIGIDPERKDPVCLFGLVDSELKRLGAWLYNGLDEPQRALYAKVISGSIEKIIPGDYTFCVTVRNEQFFIKFLDVSRRESLLKIKIRELSKDEMIDFLRKGSRIPQNIHGLFISSKYVCSPAAERWEPVLEQMKKNGNLPRTIILNKEPYNDEQKRDIGKIAMDILEKPVDRAYLNQKMSIWFPHMKKKGESIIVIAVNTIELIKESTPVQLIEVSEAGVVVEIEKNPGLKIFREFLLWLPYKVGDPELRAKLNFIEEVKSQEKDKPNNFQAHFIFFGVTELFLKKIRVWIRDLYISTKEQK